MFTIQRRAITLAAAWGLLLACAAAAQDGSSLDDAIFAPADDAKNQADALNEMLQQELGNAAIDETSNPLLGIARQMRFVENLIADVDSSDQTQQMQGLIITDMDELIRQARNRCRKCCSGAKPCQGTSPRRPQKQPDKPKPSPGNCNSKPTSTSNAQPGSAQPAVADMEEMMAVLKQIWGELPEAQRQQMLQLPIESFLPKYEWMIEQYFRRLADESALHGSP